MMCVDHIIDVIGEEISKNNYHLSLDQIRFSACCQQ